MWPAGGGSGSLTTTTPFTAGNLTLASTTTALSTYLGGTCGNGTAVQVISASGTVTCVSVTASGGAGTVTTSSPIVQFGLLYFPLANGTAINSTSGLVILTDGTLSSTAARISSGTIGSLFDLQGNKFSTSTGGAPSTTIPTNDTQILNGAAYLANASITATSPVTWSGLNVIACATCLTANTTIQVSTTTITGPTFIFTTSTLSNIWTITASGTTGFTWTIPPKNDQYFAPTTTIPTVVNTPSTTIATNLNQLVNGPGFITTSTWVINASGSNIQAINSGGSSTIGFSVNPMFVNLTATNTSSTGNVTVGGYAQVIGNLFDANGNKFVTSTTGSAPSTTIPTNNNQLVNGANFITSSSVNILSLQTSTAGSYAIGSVAFFLSSSTISASSTGLKFTSSTGALALFGNFNSSGTITQSGTAVVLNTRNVNTTAPLTGGGSLATDLTLACGGCLTKQALPSSTAWIDGQILFGQLGGTATSSRLFTVSTSTATVTFASTTVTGITKLATTTVSSTLTVGSSTANGLFSIVNASNTTVLNVSNNTQPTSSAVFYDFQTNPTSVPTSTTKSVFQILGSGHINATGTTPSVSSCGTTPNVTGTDMWGTIGVGGGVVTACTLTFKIPYESTNYHCMTGDNSATISSGVTSQTSSSITIGTSATVGGGKIFYSCGLDGL